MNTEELERKIRWLERRTGKDVPMSKEVVYAVNLGIRHARLTEQLEERKRIIEIIKSTPNLEKNYTELIEKINSSSVQEASQ